jgi:hypothetical protein
MVEPKITYKDGHVLIDAELDEVGEPSSSGKTTVLATTRGNLKVSTPDGIISVGLNIFKKP